MIPTGGPQMKRKMRHLFGEVDFAGRREGEIGEPSLDFRDPSSGLEFVRVLARNPDNITSMRRALAEESPGLDVSRLSDEDVLTQFSTQLAGRKVKLTFRPLPLQLAGDTIKPVAPTPMPAPSSASPVLSKKRDWVAIQLVDEKGKPVPGESYELTLPDGLVRRGKLNHRGQARVDDIEEPGQCVVTFPDLDRDAWERA